MEDGREVERGGNTHDVPSQKKTRRFGGGRRALGDGEMEEVRLEVVEVEAAADSSDMGWFEGGGGG